MGQKNLIKQAKEAVVKAGAHAFVDRRKKKRTSRALWQIKIGAFVREKGISYSRFIFALKANKIELDRKILSDLAVNNKTVLNKIVEELAAEKNSKKVIFYPRFFYIFIRMIAADKDYFYSKFILYSPTQFKNRGRGEAHKAWKQLN